MKLLSAFPTLVLAVAVALTAVCVRADVCDCGVTWRLKIISAVTDVTLTTSARVLVTSGVNYIPVNTLAQAQYMCYDNIYCRAVYYYTPLGSPPIAYLVMYDSVTYGALLPTTAPTSAPIPTSIDMNRAQLYELLRFEIYDCDSWALDVQTYYFGDAARRTAIEASNCPFRSSVTGACCWEAFTSGGTVCDTDTSSGNTVPGNTAQPWVQSAIAHWQTSGHRLRYSPNPTCTLTPTAWEPTARCQTERSGCFVTDGLPCSGNGVCKDGPDPGGLFPTSHHLYYCDCHNLDGSYGSVDAFAGRACQHDVLQFCTSPGHQESLCTDNNARCVSVFVTGSSPDNDYIPQCDCDSAPQLSSFGAYCEQSRCGSSACKPHTANDGICVQGTLINDTSAWACLCGNDNVGTSCEQSAASCQKTPGDTKCRGRGTCMPAGLSNVIYGSNPNYDATDAWCACTTSYSYGTYCEHFNCDTTIVAAGHGLCADGDPTTLASCLTPYTSSNTPGSLKCDVDRCAQHGGVVTGTPPNNCNCLQYQHGTGGDITCYPRCPSLDGVICGAATHGLGQSNVCAPYTDVVTGARYAKCVCDPNGYVNVNASRDAPNDPSSWSVPANQENEVCEYWCKHGELVQSFTSSCLINCDPNSNVCSCRCTGASCTSLNKCSCVDSVTLVNQCGFDTNNNSPRCDNPICKNGGTWVVGSNSCTCNGPYTSASKCVTGTCDNTATPSFVEGIIVANPLTPGTNKCSCTVPYRPSTGALLDCTANVCGLYGSVSGSLTPSTPITQICTCQSGFTTACYDNTGLNCDYCTVPTCTHGGQISIDVVTRNATCVCPFPWTGTTCAANECGLYGTPSNTLPACVCNPTYHWTGVRCDVSPCSVHGTWNYTTNECTCQTGWTGFDCASPISSTGMAFPSVSSSSTGGSGSTPSSTASASPSSTASSGQPSSSSTGAAGSELPPGTASASSAALSTATIAGISIVSGLGAIGLGYIAWTYIGPKLAASAAVSAAPAAASTTAATASISGVATGPIGAADTSVRYAVAAADYVETGEGGGGGTATRADASDMDRLKEEGDDDDSLHD